MNLKESQDLLAEIESAFPVADWKAGGIRLWPLFRIHLAYLSALSPSAGEARGGVGRRFGRLGLVADALTARWRDRAHDAPADVPADALMLTYSAARQARSGPGHVDVLLDPISRRLEGMGRKAHAWEFSQVERYRYPRASPSWPMQAALYGIQFRRALRPRVPADAEMDGYDGVRDLLVRRGVFFPILERDALLREFGHILSLRDFFGRHLDRIRPSLAFTANVSRYEMGLYLACLERGIVSVEVQHGMQGESHGHYAGWTRVPAGGYELLPGAYWSWDAESAAAINAWSAPVAPRHRAYFAGNPWLDHCRTLEAKDLEPAWAEALREDGRRKILVTLQPPDKFYEDGRLLPEFVLEAMARADRSWLWWVRLHPTMSQDTGRLAALLRERSIPADLDAANRMPLFLLLRRADLHLTHSSASVADAAKVGVRSVVWSELGAGLYEASIREGTCADARTAEGVASAMAEMLGRGRFAPRGGVVEGKPVLEALFEEAGRQALRRK